MKDKPPPRYQVIEGECAGTALCPLSSVEAGSVVCIKQFSTAPEMTARLRELGICKDQRVKVLGSEGTLICQVCNARLGLSEKIAKSILVEAVPAPHKKRKPPVAA